jgi:hypothetical protein
MTKLREEAAARGIKYESLKQARYRRRKRGEDVQDGRGRCWVRLRTGRYCVSCAVSSQRRSRR